MLNDLLVSSLLWEDGYSIKDGYSIEDGYSKEDGYSIEDGYNIEDGCYGTEDGYGTEISYSVVTMADLTLLKSHTICAHLQRREDSENNGLYIKLHF